MSLIRSERTADPGTNWWSSGSNSPAAAMHASPQTAAAAVSRSSTRMRPSVSVSRASSSPPIASPAARTSGVAGPADPLLLRLNRRIALASVETALEVHGQRVVVVRPERPDALEAHSLVQPDRLDLVDPGLEAQPVDAAGPGLRGEMLEDRLAKPLAAERGRDVHPFDLAVGRLRAIAVDQQDPAAGRGLAVGAQDVELDALLDQPVDAERVAARRRVARREVGVQLGDEPRCVGRVRALRGDGDAADLARGHPAAASARGSGAGNGCLNVNASGVGPRSARRCRRASASPTSGSSPAGTHQRTMLGPTARSNHS